MDERHLHWVQKNRKWGRQAESVGSLAARLKASPKFSGSAWQRRLLGLLEEYAGPALLDHAHVSGTRNGVLTFEVDSAVMQYELRLRWEQPLLELLQNQLPAAGIREVRFVISNQRW
jgi:hypothetical protein